MTATDPALATAWDQPALPKGWQVGRPYRHNSRSEWELYAWLPTLRAGGGRPRKDWIATGDTEVECLREMARCLVELGDGRWPK